MEKTIYGIDLDKEITPLMVRDAIIRCFMQAHKEVLDKKHENHESKSKKELESFERIQIDLIIMATFEEAKDDFDNPTKEGIERVLKLLAKFASKYREPNIIKKHYDEVMQLVNKLK